MASTYTVRDWRWDVGGGYVVRTQKRKITRQKAQSSLVVTAALMSLAHRTSGCEEKSMESSRQGE